MYHLAQINIAVGIADMAEPVMADFVSQLERINALADNSPGFVWRLQDESGDALAIRAFDDPELLVNMSVWQSLTDLRNFVYRSAHSDVLKSTRHLFKPKDYMHMSLWWVPQGHIPSLEEAKQRLAALQKNGPSEYAFTFAKPFEPEA